MIDETSALPRYQPRGGSWTKRDAWHLLVRTQYGATAEEVDAAHRAGMEATVQKLLSVHPESAEFVEIEGVLRRAALASGAINDLKAWWLYRMARSNNPLVEKMTLCWHNHFATSNEKVKSAAAMHRQNELLREHALGSFRAMLQGVARDGAMLLWLDGNANRKRAANENFARELMELFSLGVGAYTEADIQQAARAFTGWHVRNEQFWFNALQHDAGDKTVFGKKGNWNGDDVVEFCLEQPACPRFLAARLASHLVTDDPDEPLIAAIAGRIRTHDFDIRQVLDELLRSELFYDPRYRHRIIKSPLDFVLGSQRMLEVRPNWGATIQELAKLGQDIFEPPTVKGWEGGRNWVNSATLLHRANFTNGLVYSDRFASSFDPDQHVSRYQLHDAQTVASHYLELFCSRDFPSDVVEDLVRYAQGTQGSQQERIRGVVQLVMTTPEFQLM